ncbi:MAG: hypothetical protein AB4057_11675 [Crocosphaera sp.]
MYRKRTDLVSIGRLLQKLLDKNITRKETLESIELLEELFKDLELSDSLSILSSLKPLRIKLDEIIEKAPSSGSGLLSSLSHHTFELTNKIDVIIKGLDNELSKQTYIITDEFPKALKNITDFYILEDYQKALLDDCILTLKCRIWKSAIVVSWNFGFDIVRKWIFDNEVNLDKFNKNLLDLRKKKVDKYSDFFGVHDKIILQSCFPSKDKSDRRILDEKTYTKLLYLLDSRNNYAHANYDLVSEHTAKDYIIQFIKIITEPPFINLDKDDFKK